MRHIEDAEAMALWSWAQTQPIVRDHLYAIPNGGKRGIMEAARLKKMGVRAGVSDYHLPISRGGFIGLWFELKAPGGRLSPDQKKWILRMQEAGHMAVVACGWAEAKNVIEKYMGGQGNAQIDDGRDARRQ